MSSFTHAAMCRVSQPGHSDELLGEEKNALFPAMVKNPHFQNISI